MKFTKHLLIFILLFSLVTNMVNAQKVVKWSKILNQKSVWYGSTDAIHIADNVLLYQKVSGGWPKNIDMANELTLTEKKELNDLKEDPEATIDNGATHTQLRFLALVYTSTKLKRFRDAFDSGIVYLLEAQYANGGWPQYYPLKKNYSVQITFNDNAMPGVLNLLHDIVSGKKEYQFVDDQIKKTCKQAIVKGIDCILKCQIKDKGKLTAWCAQHDPKTFEPALARSFELPSYSSKETIDILEFLLKNDNPTPQIITAVQAGVEWLQKVKITGVKQIQVKDTLSPYGYDKRIVPDPTASPLWSRFYELETNRAFFCSRDGIKHYDLSEISYERRNNYGWMGDWPQEFLDKKYPVWLKKWVTK